MKAVIILTVFFAIGFVWSTSVKAEDDWQKVFYANLRQIHSKDYQKEPSLAEIAGATMQLDSKMPELEFPALFKLWLSDYSDQVELHWWKSRNRSTRTFAVALFYCAYDLKMDHLPSFLVEAERFQPEEAKQRKEETAFVLSHRGEIAGILAKCTEGIRREKDLHDRYETQVDLAGNWAMVPLLRVARFVLP
jgi:hypothetical protein